MNSAKHSTFNARHSTLNEVTGEVWELNDGPKPDRKFDLEDRLLELASAVRDTSLGATHQTKGVGE